MQSASLSQGWEVIMFKLIQKGIETGPASQSVVQKPAPHDPHPNARPMQEGSWVSEVRLRTTPLTNAAAALPIRMSSPIVTHPPLPSALANAASNLVSAFDKQSGSTAASFRTA